MEVVSNQRIGKAQRVVEDGVTYLVAPLVSIRPGVLAGSKGPLMYPEEHVKASTNSWDGMPLTVYHPQSTDGSHVSAYSPGVYEKQGVGHLRNSTYAGKLKHEAWFNEADVKRIDPRVHDALVHGRTMEVSTGLFTDNLPQPGTHEGRSYGHVATNYRPDHMAILPDQRGACSVHDGCGLNVNVTNAAGKFHRPENFDKVRDLPDGDELWAGANDWEDGWTWAAIFPSGTKGDYESQTSPKKWLNVNHDDCPACDGTVGEMSNDRKTVKACMEWAKGQVDEWAKGVQNSNGSFTHADVELELNANPEGHNQYSVGSAGKAAHAKTAAADQASALARDSGLRGDHQRAAMAHAVAVGFHEAAHEMETAHGSSALGWAHTRTSDRHRAAVRYHTKESKSAMSHNTDHEDVELGFNSNPEGHNQFSGGKGSSHLERLKLARANGKAVLKTATGFKEYDQHGTTHYDHAGFIMKFEPVTKIHNHGGYFMTRSQLLEVLTANCTCDTDKAALNSLSNETLVGIANAMPDFIQKKIDAKNKKRIAGKGKDADDDDDDDTDDDKPSKNATMKAEGSNADVFGSGFLQVGMKGTPDEYLYHDGTNPGYRDGTNPNPLRMRKIIASPEGARVGNRASTLKEWEESMPPEALAVWNTAKQAEMRERKAIIDHLTANVHNADKKAKLVEKFMTMNVRDLHELIAIAAPAPVRRVPVPDPIYLGSNAPGNSGVTGNRDDGDILDLPTMSLFDAK